MSRSYISSFSVPLRSGAAARLFLARLVASAAVAAVAISALIYVALDRMNELYLIHIDRLMHDETILWGPLFQQSTPTWQLNRTAIKRPQVLMVGSSRVTQFREAMLPGVRFYNASLSASSLWDVESFLSTLYAVHKPKLVLVGIDPWWFDATRDPKPGRPTTVPWEFSPTEQVANLLRQAGNAREFMDMISSSIEVVPDPLGRRTPVGYNATAKASGFRPDGSYQYGAVLLGKSPLYEQAAMDFRHGFEHDRDQVRRVAGRFGYVGAPSARAADTLRRIVRLNREAGVDLILFFPPLAHAVHDEIEAMPAQREYFSRIAALTRDITAESDIEFHDFEDYATLGIDDSQTIDGIHVDEIGSLAELRAMAHGGGALSRMVPTETAHAMDALATAPRTLNPHLVAP
jgi:hypothetical protein